MRLALRALLLVAVTPLLSGCFFFPYGLGASGSDSGSASASAAAADAQAKVRGAIPAIEAYYADNGTYSGVTLEALQAYDHGVVDVRIVAANDQTYCLESGSGANTFSKAGPAADILPIPCPPAAAAPDLPEAADTLRAAVRGMEAWRSAHGSFSGITLKELKAFTGPLDNLRVAHLSPGSYCLELQDGNTTWIARETGDVGVGSC